jgi:large subunit ribosomal protein L18
MGLRTQKRRRRECKTDYKARRIMLVSGLPRIVVRRTNKYFILQAVESHEAQDKVLMTVTSKELLKNGWDKKRSGSLKGISAGYLTGILMAKKLKKGKYIVDLGMARTLKGGRMFAVIAGLVEGGLDIPHNSEVFPSEERLMGEHADIKDMVTKVKGSLAARHTPSKTSEGAK